MEGYNYNNSSHIEKERNFLTNQMENKSDSHRRAQVHTRDKTFVPNKIRAYYVQLFSTCVYFPLCIIVVLIILNNEIRETRIERVIFVLLMICSTVAFPE